MNCEPDQCIVDPVSLDFRQALPAVVRMNLYFRIRAAALVLLVFCAGTVLAESTVRLHAFERLGEDFAASIEPRGQGYELELAGFGQRWSLVLEPNDALLGALGADARRAVQGRDNLFLAGQVLGVPGSWVRLSRVDGRWSGGFDDGLNLYLIDRANGLELPAGRQAAPDEMLLYRFSDLDLGPILLHRPLTPADQPPASADYAEFLGHLREIVALSGGAAFMMPITVVTDTQFNSSFGANTAAVVAARSNFIDGLYSSQLGTGILLLHHEPLTDNGPLLATGASALLTEFRQFMFNGAGSSIPFQGLAHLFTSRPRDGSIAGIAFLGVLCNTAFGYGVDWNLSNETTNGLVFAHEVGHNFNAPHDGEGACIDEPFRGIMNPSINGSQQFSDCSLEQMSGAVANASCLMPNPFLDALFSDGFEDN